jgi:hypothetical protein
MERSLAATDKELQEWALRGVEGVQFVIRYAAPDRPRIGLVVYADGTLWNPGSGEGLYVYTSGGWVAL